MDFDGGYVFVGRLSWIWRNGFSGLDMVWDRRELALVGWISGYVKLFCFVMLILLIIFPVFLYYYYYLLCVYDILLLDQLNYVYLRPWP